MNQEYYIGDIFPGLFAASTYNASLLLKEIGDKNIEVYALIEDKPRYVKKVELGDNVHYNHDHQIVELLLNYYGYDTSVSSCNQWEEILTVESKKVNGDYTSLFKFKRGKVQIFLNERLTLERDVKTYRDVIDCINKF